MLMVLMSGNATTDGAENPVVRHMSSNGTGNTPADATDCIRGGVPTDAETAKGQQYSHNAELHLLHPSLLGTAECTGRLCAIQVRNAERWAWVLAASITNISPARSRAAACYRTGNRISPWTFNYTPASRAFAGLLREASFVEEEGLRALIFATLFSVAISTAAFADESVSGDWHANVGSGVTINMNVTSDGAWSSETFQQNQVVRQMRGTYKQLSSNNETGTLIFTPTQASVKSGKVQTETDKYQLTEDGKQLKLTSGGDTMVFEKRTQP